MHTRRMRVCVCRCARVLVFANVYSLHTLVPIVSSRSHASTGMTYDDKLGFDKLGDKNYATWAGNFSALARKKKFHKIMMGKELKPVMPEAADKLSDWENRSSVGAGELYLAVEGSQTVHLKGLEDDVKLMWEKLEGIHIQKRPATRFNAYTALFNVRMQSMTL